MEFIFQRGTFVRVCSRPDVESTRWRATIREQGSVMCLRHMAASPWCASSNVYSGAPHEKSI